MMTVNLSRRLEQLEARTAPVKRIRTCWKGCEPDNLASGDILYVLSWCDEGEEDNDAA